MKVFVYLISIIAIIALAGLFVFKQPNGQAWLSLDGFLPDTQVINEKINLVTKKVHKIFDNNKAEINNKVKVYRWKDSNGNWSYSDNPDASMENEEMLFDPKNIVVLPAFDVPTVNSSDTNSKEKHDNVSPNTLMTSPRKVLELYKDANNVQQLMDDRQKKVSKAIKDNNN